MSRASRAWTNSIDLRMKHPEPGLLEQQRKCRQEKAKVLVHLGRKTISGILLVCDIDFLAFSSLFERVRCLLTNFWPQRRKVQHRLQKIQRTSKVDFSRLWMMKHQFGIIFASAGQIRTSPTVCVRRCASKIFAQISSALPVACIDH